MPAFERVKKSLDDERRVLRQAQDEETFFVPSRIYLILSLSKDARRICSGPFDRMQFPHTLFRGQGGY